MISPYSLSVPGGVQGQILGLARALREAGHAVRVLGPCDGPPPEPFVTPLGNSIPTGANGSIAPIAPDPAAQLRTIRALRDEDFDVLHVHEPLAPGPTMTALVLKPAPIVATFHAAGSSLAYDFFKPLTTIGSRRIDLRFAVSEDARALAQGAVGGEYELAFNAVEVRRFAAATPRLTPEGRTVLFLARHEQRKGLEVLLDALGSLDPSIRLWVGGVGPETAALRARHADDERIQWLGELDESEKMAAMKGADVFCAPSLHGESFGVVLLEAMAANTAVIASNLSGYAKVTQDGRSAMLVEPGDRGALADAIHTLLGSRERRDELVRSGAERVKEFSMHSLAEFYLDAYRRVAAQGA